MRDTKLIFVEGPPGSGKTTTAGWLAEALADRGADARHLREGDPLHQLDVGGSLHPSGGAGRVTGAALFAQYTVDSYIDESLARWASFVANAEHQDAVHVVECYPYQSAARVLWQMDAPIDRSRGYAAALEEIVAPLRPVLVFFERRDPVAAFQAIAEQRGPDWTALIVAIVVDSPLFRRLGTSDLAAALRAVELYKSFLDDLRARSRIPALVLDDDIPWETRYEMIRELLAI